MGQSSSISPPGIKKNWIISKFVDRIFHQSLPRARKESQIAQQASAGDPLSTNPPVGHPQSAAGVGEVSLEEITNTPATGEERYLPHDCKQDDFPFGPMKSQDILKKISSLPFNEFGDEAKKDRQREK